MKNTRLIISIFIALVAFAFSMIGATNNSLLLYDYAEDISSISGLNTILSWLVLLGIIVSFLSVISIIFFNISTQFRHRLLQVMMVLVLVLNIIISFVGTGWIERRIVSERCDTFLEKSDMQKIYDEKILNVFAELQKQDSRFKSISLKPLEGRLRYCPGKEILVIKYDGTMNDVMQLNGPFSKVEQKLHGILYIREYDFSTSDKPGGIYQLFK